MEERSLLSVPSPTSGCQVYLQPEVSAFTPERSFFRAADWIYSHEKHMSMDSTTVTLGASPPPRSLHKRTRLPARYLVNRLEKDGKDRLHQALWQNPLAFYYYKKRHLFQPYTRTPRPNSTVTTTKPRPNTTAHAVRVSSQTCRPFTSPVKPRTQSSDGGDFLTTLLGKCEKVPASRPVTSRAMREKKTLQEFHKRFDWTQRTLSQISDCEADLIIPFYLDQKEALEEMKKDAKKTAEEYRRAVVVPSIGVARFERVLRRNKNQVL